jgi:hypothetical protein
MKNLDLGMKSNARPSLHLLPREEESQSSHGTQKTDAACHFAPGLGRAMCLILAFCTVLLERPAAADWALYASSTSNNKIMKFTTNGVATVFATNGVNGVLASPEGLALDDLGNLYVVNEGNRTIERYTPQGIGSLFATLPSGSVCWGAALDASNNLYVANTAPGQILVVNPAGQVSTNESGAPLDEPYDLAFDSGGNLFVANSLSGTVVKYDPQGNVSIFTAPGHGPVGLAFDSADNLYVGLTTTTAINRYAPLGNTNVFVPSLGHTPWGMAFDTLGNLYVAGESDSSIEKVTPPGTVTVFASASSGLFATAYIAIRETCYQDNWNKVAGGGGTSANGEFVINGTIGQQDAGTTMIGGEYSMAGGFWARISAVPTAGAPALTISITMTNTAMVSWPSPSTGWNLQQTTNLTTSAWVAAPETVNDNGTIRYIIVSPPTGNLFFRLMQ